MHIRNSSFGIGLVDVENVRRAAIGIELSIHGQIQVAYLPILTKNLAQMFFGDIFGEAFDNDLGAAACRDVTRAVTSLSIFMFAPTPTRASAISIPSGVMLCRGA